LHHRADSGKRLTTCHHPPAKPLNAKLLNPNLSTPRKAFNSLLALQATVLPFKATQIDFHIQRPACLAQLVLGSGVAAGTSATEPIPGKAAQSAVIL
jgi:hypothetical protein